MINFIAAVFISALTFGLIYGEAVMEAKSYNRITGAHVTAWDAMFVELRVDGCSTK